MYNRPPMIAIPSPWFTVRDHLTGDALPLNPSDSYIGGHNLKVASGVTDQCTDLVTMSVSCGDLRQVSRHKPAKQCLCGHSVCRRSHDVMWRVDSVIFGMYIGSRIIRV